MAIQWKIGSFGAKTTTGNQAYTGVGFQPQVVLFVIHAGDTSGDNAFSGNDAHGIGVAVSSTERWAFSSQGANTSFPFVCKCGSSATKALLLDWVSGSTLIEAGLVSQDSDGFTLNYTTVDGIARRVFYLALAGLSGVKAGIVTIPTSGSTVSVTGVGFQPDALIFIANGETSLGTGKAHSRWGIGFADSALNQVASSAVAGDGDTAAGYNWRNGAVILDTNSSGTQSTRVNLQSMDSSGFTLSVADSPGAAADVGYIALDGVRSFVGTDTEKTSNGTQAKTGVGFQPKLLLFHTAQATASGGGSNAYGSFGISDGTTHKNTWYGQGSTGISANTDTYHASGAAIAHRFSVGNENHGDATVTMDSDGYTATWSNTDGTAREHAFLALADLVVDPFAKSGGGVSGLVGAGASTSITVEAGRGIAGLVGAGARQSTSGATYIKVGRGVVGTVGSGPKIHTHPGSTYTKAGRGIIGNVATGNKGTGASEFHEDVVPTGISIAFGQPLLEPYPTWTRIDT